MEHPFFPMTTTRPEALRWLTIAEKLLSARDLMGSKSFATRARDADPTLSPADQILAVVDTLLAGDMRIGNNLQDLYAILRLTPQQGRDAELIDRQYRSLALILNPQKNNFPFAEQAFALVLDAWSVLSNPSRKLMYDKELAFYLQPQPPPQQPTDMFGNPIPAMHHNIFAGVSSSSGVSYHSQPQGVTYPPPPQPQPQPQPHSTVHFSQVHGHSNSPVEPVVGESVRVPPNLMNFSPAPAPNIVFGTGLGSKPGIESLNKQPQETTYSHFQGNAAAATAPETSQAQMSNNQEQPQQNYSNVGDGSSHTHNVNVNENVQEEEPPIEEEEEDVERMEAEEEEEEEEIDAPTDEIDDDPLPFWTACPYCYYMYEYPRVYVDCTLRCSNCKMAFQAVVIPSPPPILDGQEGYFCCWGFLPMGFSMEHWEKNKAAASKWTPFSPMFNLPHGWGNNPKRQPGSRKMEPRIYIDDDEVFVEFSDSSESDDDDWRNTQSRRKKKRGSGLRGRGASGTPNRTSKRGQTEKGKTVEAQDGLVPPEGVETTTPNKTAGGDANNKVPAVVTARKQPARAAKNFGKLDLNVECSNEAEEAAPRANEENGLGHGHGHGHGHGGDDNIEGIGFFEGLDEFLSSLPILNVVGDEKVVKAA